jgi:ATP:cob(I)alamin adenosyltransferase
MVYNICIIYIYIYILYRREYCAFSKNGIESMLIEIQCRLFDIGSAIATPIASSSEDKLAYVKFSSSFTSELEKWIDELDLQLPPLKNFVIPSGGLSSVHLNYARTICRRTERSVVPLIESKWSVCLLYIHTYAHTIIRSTWFIIQRTSFIYYHSACPNIHIRYYTNSF